MVARIIFASADLCYLGWSEGDTQAASDEQQDKKLIPRKHANAEGSPQRDP